MEKNDLKKYLHKRFSEEKGKWIAAGCPKENKDAETYTKRVNYHWDFSLYDGSDWVFEVNWCRNLGLLGESSTRVVVKKKGTVHYNIYCWDYNNNKVAINNMSTWMWNRLTGGDLDGLRDWLGL